MSLIPNTTTENRAPSYSTTGNPVVDLFFKMVRNFDINPNFSAFVKSAVKYDPLKTLKVIFHARDCRGGKGERDIFYQALKEMYNLSPEWVEYNVVLAPFYGYWLDLPRLLTYIPELRSKFVDIMGNQLQHDRQSVKPSLLAKWLPSEGKRWERATGITKDVANFIYTSQELSTRQKLRLLRQEYLTPLRREIDIPERLMCQGQWDGIQLSNVPSKALTKYRKALKRHLPEKYKEWLQRVREGKADIKAKQNYPHELVNTVFKGSYDETIEQQWLKMCEQFKGNANLNDAIVLSDVSGSMMLDNNGLPLQVSIALGIMIAECTSEPYNGLIITFSEMPQFHRMSGTTLEEKVKDLQGMNFGMNTDIEKVFNLILERATEKNLPADEMPSRLIILSDMQFDTASGCDGKDLNTTFDNIDHKYKVAGYKRPQIIFWNLRADNTGDVPVRKTEQGVALISGFSPELLMSFLSSDEMTPEIIVNQILANERYSFIEPPPEQKMNNDTHTSSQSNVV